MTSLGFIISRHISQPAHADLCFRAYSSARRFYPENPIVIVDDNSSIADSHEYDACTTVIQSIVPKSGEFGLYYYYHSLRPFDRAVLLHDSMVLKYADSGDVSGDKSAVVGYLAAAIGNLRSD